MDYRFQLDDPYWKQFLIENGFVVVTCIAADVAAEYLQRVWTDIESLSGGRVDRNNIQSRISSNYPYTMHGGMIQYMGHSQVQWDVRATVAKVFANLYDVNEDNLSSSFDGLCFMDGARKYRDRPDISFLHVDQAPSKNFRYSIQGFLNLAECGPNDGGLVVVPGSHEYVEYWINHDALNINEDWYLFTADEKAADPMFNESLKVCCAAGDFVMWDSRTWHCNTVPKTRAIRSVIYVCMLPKSLVPDKIKQRRKKAFAEGRVSTHHPGNGFKLFPKKPRWCDDIIYNRAIEIQNRLVMTPLQKTLADVQL